MQDVVAHLGLTAAAATAPAPAPPVPRRLRLDRLIVELIGVIGAIVSIFFFGRMVVEYRPPFVPEVDSQGYFLMARSFSHFQWPSWQEDYAKYHGHVFVDVGGGRVMAKYPPGWPMLLAVGYRLGGLDGALWVNAVMALIGAAAFYLLGRELFDPAAALVCTIIWLFSPMMVFYVSYPLTHGPDITCTLVAFWLVARWAKSGSVWYAAPAGLLMGFMPLIRPTSALMWPAMIVMALSAAGALTGGTRARAVASSAGGGTGGTVSPPRLWRRRRVVGFALFALAVAIPVVFLAYYNWRSFGAPWRTGYWLSSEQGAFTFAKMGKRINEVFAGRNWLLADRYWLVCLAGLLLRRRSGFISMVALVLWFVPTVGLYSGYYFFSGQPGFLRFFLSAFPACVLCAGLLFPSGEGWRPAGVRLVVLAAFGVWFLFDSPHGPRDLNPLTPDARYTAMRPLLDKPTAVYATGVPQWTAGSRDGMVSYDLSLWIVPDGRREPHFFRPYNEKLCAQGDVKEDMARHKKLHAWFAALGKPGVKRDFLEHIAADLAAGRQVLAAGARADQLGWIRDDGRWRVEEMGKNTGIWRVEEETGGQGDRGTR